MNWASAFACGALFLSLMGANLADVEPYLTSLGLGGERGSLAAALHVVAQSRCCEPVSALAAVLRVEADKLDSIAAAAKDAAYTLAAGGNQSVVESEYAICPAQTADDLASSALTALRDWAPDGSTVALTASLTALRAALGATGVYLAERDCETGGLRHLAASPESAWLLTGGCRRAGTTAVAWAPLLCAMRESRDVREADGEAFVGRIGSGCWQLPTVHVPDVLRLAPGTTAPTFFSVPRPGAFAVAPIAVDAAATGAGRSAEGSARTAALPRMLALAADTLGFGRPFTRPELDALAAVAAEVCRKLAKAQAEEAAAASAAAKDAVSQAAAAESSLDEAPATLALEAPEAAEDMVATEAAAAVTLAAKTAAAKEAAAEEAVADAAAAEPVVAEGAVADKLEPEAKFSEEVAAASDAESQAASLESAELP